MEELSSKILTAARKHFSQYGFHGASLKDIASDAGVASSLINYHYKDKNGLFKAVLEEFTHPRMESLERVLAEPHSREEMRVRLSLFVEEMFASILADPEGFELLDREMHAGNAVIMKLFEESLMQPFQNVVMFIVQAQNNGLLKEGVDPIICANLLFTCACDTARKDHLLKKFLDISLADGEWRKKFSEQIVDLFLSGVVK